VKPQQPVRDALVVVVATRVHAHAEISSQKLSLVLSEVRQHAAELYDKKRCDK
jgi:hypothetical protein